MRRFTLATAFAQALALGIALTGAAASAQPSGYPSPDQRDFLVAHNEARADAGAPPLVWSDRLERDAEDWARHLAARGLYEHSSPDQRRGQGENLWRGPRDQWSVWDKVGFFIEEKRHFRPGNFPDISRTGRWNDVGHYTQIIWPETREVGCAIAYTRADEVLVCRYWPAGNIWGQRIDPRASRARR